MGSCAAPSAKGDDKFITTDYLQQCPPKDVAADWAIKRLPAQYQPVLLEAKQAYLGQKEDHLASRADHLEEFIRFVKGEIIKSVGK